MEYESEEYSTVYNHPYNILYHHDAQKHMSPGILNPPRDAELIFNSE